MKQLKLLPLTADVVEHKVNAFRHYTDEVLYPLWLTYNQPLKLDAVSDSTDSRYYDFYVPFVLMCWILDSG